MSSMALPFPFVLAKKVVPGTPGFFKPDLNSVWLTNSQPNELADLFSDDVAKTASILPFITEDGELIIDFPVPAHLTYFDALDMFGAGTVPLDVFWLAPGSNAETKIGIFDGNTFGDTVHYPLPGPLTPVRRIIFRGYTKAPVWPHKLTFYGLAPEAEAPLQIASILADRGFGTNGHNYDLVDIGIRNPTGNPAISTRAGDGVHAGMSIAKHELMRSAASGMRYYLNINTLRAWQNMHFYASTDRDLPHPSAVGAPRTPAGTYRQQIAMGGGYYDDDLYLLDKATGQQSLLCIINTPIDVALTWYPEGTPVNQVDDNARPYPSTADPLNVNSWAWIEEAAEQVVMRNGAVVHDPSQSKYATVEMNDYDPRASVIKTGQNTGIWYSFLNEINKWWRGASAYTRPQYAAVGLLAAKRGMQRADPSAKLVGPCFVGFNAGEFEELFDQWDAMGVPCPLDYASGHSYSTLWVRQPDGSLLMRGVPTGISGVRERQKAVLRVIQRRCPGLPLIHTEGGYGVSSHGETSPSATANVSVAQWQAILTVNEIESDLSLGILRFGYQLCHEEVFLNHPDTDSIYSDISCGIVDMRALVLYQSGAYSAQLKRLLSGWMAHETAENESWDNQAVTVTRYTKAGAGEIRGYRFVDSAERLGYKQITVGANGADLYEYAPTGVLMNKQALAAGTYTRPVTHLPFYVHFK